MELKTVNLCRFLLLGNVIKYVIEILTTVKLIIVKLMLIATDAI